MEGFITSLTALLALAAQAIGITMNISTSIRNSKKDTSESQRQMGELLADLKYIRGSVDSIQTKIDKQEERNSNFDKRILEDEKAVEILSERVSNLKETVTKVETRVKILEDKVNEGSVE